MELHKIDFYSKLKLQTIEKLIILLKWLKQFHKYHQIEQTLYEIFINIDQCLQLTVSNECSISLKNK